jgi:hypothetical protein
MEPLAPSHLIGFLIIWTALVYFILEGFGQNLTERQNRLDTDSPFPFFLPNIR